MAFFLEYGLPDAEDAKDSQKAQKRRSKKRLLDSSASSAFLWYSFCVRQSDPDFR